MHRETRVKRQIFQKVTKRGTIFYREARPIEWIGEYNGRDSRIPRYICVCVCEHKCILYYSLTTKDYCALRLSFCCCWIYLYFRTPKVRFWLPKTRLHCSIYFFYFFLHSSASGDPLVSEKALIFLFNVCLCRIKNAYI